MAKLVWKLVIIGDPAVGKTSIRRKYLGETTLKEYIYTIGADFATKRIKLSNDLTVQYQIFDLAGQQKFDKVRATFYSGCQAAVLVYDITNNDSLKNLHKWVKEAKKNSDGKIETFVIVGNKIDLTDKKQTSDGLLKKILDDLSKEMGHKILHIYTSALTGENIDLLFRKITEQLLIEAGKESSQIAKLSRDAGITAKTSKKPETAPVKQPDAKIEPISAPEKRIKQLELEVNNLKSTVKDLEMEVDQLKETMLKYLHDHKKLLDSFKF
ncbi:MAG: Rab family GTPase [Candidatus Heimdallarchaeota archaeon]